VRADLAPLALNAAYLVVGYGVLAACNSLPGRWSTRVAAAGLAFLLGVAAVLLVTIAAVSLGISIDLGAMCLLFAATAAAAWATAWRRKPAARAVSKPREWRPPIGRAERWIAVAIVAAIGAYAIYGFAAAWVDPTVGWDSAQIWTRKALLFLEYGGPTHDFESPYYGYAQPGYPILLPLFDSFFFRASGTTSIQSLHGEFWIMFIAFVWAAGYTASRVSRPIVWAPIVGAIAVTPGLADGILTLQADVPMALFLGLGTLQAGIWLSGRRGGDLALAIVLLGAAANTKNEGLPAAVLVLAIALCAAALDRNRPGLLRVALFAGGGLAAAVLPWRIWVAVHTSLTTSVDVDASKAVDPAFLVAHADRAWLALTAMAHQLSESALWLFLLPLALGIAVFVFVTGRDRLVSAFYLAVGVSSLLAILVWGYVVNRVEIHSLIYSTERRTVMPLLLIAAAALLHLTGVAAAPAAEDGPDLSSPSRPDRGPSS
jgi:hypothetical protein